MKPYATYIFLSVLLIAVTSSCSRAKGAALTTSQVIAYRVAGIQKKADAAIRDMEAAKQELKVIQEKSASLLEEVGRQTDRADKADKEKATILGHFNKLLFIASSLAAAAAVLSILQIPILMGPYRLYLALGAGILTFAATWAILGHL